ncbi:ACSL4 [Cordylochernes scorpioides]|uniref:long-chain-fatty-acid--CoA ligase n=1 Tax=Cordylochernes scorpioides TaxID=51811 RepID=A0ABY6KRY0_9ARAC|nr:ACSL4 [Cordylochernes scorpioides]
MGDYRWISFKQVDKKIDNLGKGFQKLGVKPKDNVLVFAETSASWMLSAQALLRMNVTVVTLYATLGEDGLIHGINETEVSHVVTSQELLPKVKAIIDLCPNVKHVIYIEGFGQPSVSFPSGITLHTLTSVERLGAQVEAITPVAVAGLSLPRPTPEDVAIIMYTSGSTGPPKGVMLAHRNIVATARGFADTFPDVRLDDVYIAFLPLAHVFELATECAFLCHGVPLGYSSPQTLTDRSTGIKRGLRGDASVLRPTIVAAVPLVLDRIRKGVMEVVNRKPILSQKLFRFGMAYKRFWVQCGFQTPLLDGLLFKTIRKTVGGRLRNIVCGSAPLSPDTHEFIRLTFSCQIIQGYGLTETAAGGTAMVCEYPWLSCTTPVFFPNLVLIRKCRAGPECGHCGTSSQDLLHQTGNYSVDDKPNPRGEVVIGGNVVSLGYYKNPGLTETVFKKDADGMSWFYTGDIGEFQPNGNLKIIDRKKDLVKLQMGEYISLGKVEAELKTSPMVENICVYGNGFRSFVVALVVPNKAHLHQIATELGKGGLSYAECCSDPEITLQVLKVLRQHGLQARLHRVELPQRVTLCSEEWLPESGMVTAAFKLRRKVIEQYYQAAINKMYDAEEGADISKST